MPFFKKLQVVTGRANKILRNRFLWVITMLFISFMAASQQQRVLNPNVYKNFTRPDAQIKIQMIDKGVVQKTDTAALTNFRVPVNKKTVISYKKLSAIDEKSLQIFKANLKLPYSPEEIKIIPELHVEAGGDQTEDRAYGIVFTLQQPLHYNDSLKKFSATLGFLLASESENNYTPIEPVKIEVVSNEVSSIKPASFEINHLSIPSSNVELIADQVNDSASVKVITVSNTAGYITYLRVRPVLEISTNRSRLQGFGIQEIPVSVRFVGSSSSDSANVSFSSEKGTVTPNSVYVAYNKSVTIYLRSEGIGNSKLSAISNSVKSNELNFRYVFPWLFLLASILGGLLGSLAKHFLAVKEKKSSIKPIIGGVLIGLIGAIAYYGLGVSLLGISLSTGLNELAVLALSALCAYFGISIIKLDGKQ